MRDKLDIDLVIVDEAHKIGDPQRGVILQDAIERLLRSSPDMRVAFVSPATQNPEILLEDAPDTTTKRAIDSDVATVLQNIIVAHQVPAKPTKWALQFRDGHEYLPVGTLTLPSKPNTIRKRLAFIAASIGQRGGTLVYANGAADAEAVALLISQLTQKAEKVDQELADLADLARKCVHKNYMLGPLVERGVAFHYGNMPSLVRMEIERLFRTGKLKFLVCTSTLIEGVNLSCRTIVVRGPKKGKSTPMEPHDFWNLAGRAGRWGDEFQGNIICIDATDQAIWPSGVPQRTRYPIRRETDIALSKIDELTTYISDRSTGDPPDADRVRAFEQVSAYLTTSYMREGSIAAAPWAKRKTEEDIRKLEEVLARSTAGMGVNPDIGSRNPGVSLFGLERLLTYFRAYPGHPEDLLLAPSESEDAYDRFTEIMGRLNENVLTVFLPSTLIPLHALIVLEWMKGFSLPTIISRRMEYLQRRGTAFDTATVIRSTLDLIETTARFLAPRYFSAYVDVLNQHLREIGREDLIDNDLDIGVALEFGVTSITMRSLMELGMSRISAVALYEIIALDGLDEEGCFAWVKEHQNQLDGLGLPVIRSPRGSRKGVSEDFDGGRLVAKPVELSNGRIWETKSAAKQYFKEMLARYHDGDEVTDYDDHSDLSALLERFDVLVADGAPKIGVGIERFERRLNKGDGWSSTGFWVVRTDRTSTDFSYVKAVDGNPKSQSQEFYDACHNAVSRDLLHLKQRQFDHFSNADGEIECDITGQLVVYADANLSHATPSFGTIVNDYRKAKGWELAFPTGTLTYSKDAQLSTHFADDALAREFKSYHHKVAVLRIVAKAKPPGSTAMSLSVKRPLGFT